jgi:hypothetical protein
LDPPPFFGPLEPFLAELIALPLDGAVLAAATLPLLGWVVLATIVLSILAGLVALVATVGVIMIDG